MFQKKLQKGNNICLNFTSNFDSSLISNNDINLCSETIITFDINTGFYREARAFDDISFIFNLLAISEKAKSLTL